QADSLKTEASNLAYLDQIARGQGKKLTGQRFLELEEAYQLDWAADYLESQKEWGVAYSVLEKSQGITPELGKLLRLFGLADTLNQEIDFNRILQLKEETDFKEAAKYFKERGLWSKAARLYERSYSLSPSPKTLIQLYELSDSLEQGFDFGRFLALDASAELEEVGNYFIEGKEWERAKKLYEKSYLLTPNSKTLIQLYELSDSLDQSFDTSRFLALPDLVELDRAASHFLQVNDSLMAQKLSAKIQESCEEEIQPELDARSRYVLMSYCSTPRFDELFLVDSVEQLLDFIAFLGSQDPDSILLEQLHKLCIHAQQFQPSLAFDSLGDVYFQYAWDEQMLSGMYKEGEIMILHGLELAPDNAYLTLIYPAALLFQGKYAQAGKEIEKWREVPWKEKERDSFEFFKDGYKRVFEILEADSLIPKEHESELERIKALLMGESK
ncbi:MAG: hypothetical protein AAGA10_19205, partial [Bacteroidota bacterium]